MQPDAKATLQTPSSRPTMPRLNAATPTVRHLVSISTTPRWVESMRRESRFVPVTVALDVWSSVWAVVLAHWFMGDSGDQRHVLTYSWLFVPIVMVVLAARSMYKRKLNHRFLDDFEPVETSVAVSVLTTLALLLLIVPEFQSDALTGQYVRPSEVMVRIWLWAAVLMPAVRPVRSMAQRYL